MVEDLIQYNTAVLAKIKNFNLTCEKGFSYYTKESSRDNKLIPIGTVESFSSIISNDKCFSSNGMINYARPTQTLLKKWLMITHKIHLYVWYKSSNKTFKLVLTNGDNNPYFYENEFTTEEYALEYGLQEALNLI